MFLWEIEIVMWKFWLFWFQKDLGLVFFRDIGFQVGLKGFGLVWLRVDICLVFFGLLFSFLGIQQFWVRSFWSFKFVNFFICYFFKLVLVFLGFGFNRKFSEVIRGSGEIGREVLVEKLVWYFVVCRLGFCFLVLKVGVFVCLVQFGE